MVSRATAAPKAPRRDTPRFRSVLFPDTARAEAREVREAPACFTDLKLDPVVRAATAGWEEFDLAPLFHAPLDDLDAIRFRQEVVRDLERADVMSAVLAWSRRLREVRVCGDRAEKSSYRYEGERWFLRAAELYCDAVEQLHRDLDGSELGSRALRALHAYLDAYVAAPAFAELAREARRLSAELAAIRYTLLLEDGRVTVRAYQGESDLGAAVEETFAKFRHGAAGEPRLRPPAPPGMSHVQAQILEGLARLHPEVFAALRAFRTAQAGFVDATLARFDREIHFYVAYLTYLERFRSAGLDFCLPELSEGSKEVHSRESFDLALAENLIAEQKRVVTNDFWLRGRERILVVTGPNQGGKTTFARTFGQLHYLARLGLPVPGREARLFFCDRIFTHFERAESIRNLRGKLQDDLLRIRAILQAATPRSIVILNEIFSSTTLQDAIFLSRKILAELSRLDVLGVCVTFLGELASFDEKTVSLVAGVDPQDPTVRTFLLQRRPADDLAYALAIAAKYGLTEAQLRTRIVP